MKSKIESIDEAKQNAYEQSDKVRIEDQSWKVVNSRNRKKSLYNTISAPVCAQRMQSKWGVFDSM